MAAQRPEGVTAPRIVNALDAALSRRALKCRLKARVDGQSLAGEGSGRWARYRSPKDVSLSLRATADVPRVSVQLSSAIQLFEADEVFRNHVGQPSTLRKLIGYDWDFPSSYHPKKTHLLSERERAELREVDTLIEFGEEVQGKNRREALKILNHKEAIEILVEAAERIDFNCHTILNLHGALADNLLPDPRAPGRIRRPESQLRARFAPVLGLSADSQARPGKRRRSDARRRQRQPRPFRQLVPYGRLLKSRTEHSHAVRRSVAGYRFRHRRLHPVSNSRRRAR